jgi:predicted GNAT superfamily acetyltransferase
MSKVGLISPDLLTIRQLETLEDFSNVVRLQREIWGFADVELLPRRLFVVASKIGGQLLGAFDGDQMVAFCLCIPGLKAGATPYLHSHMLGVLPGYRNTGLGRRMKLVQREYALKEGIDLIEWTFDPLEIKNAFFNIERLGAIVRRYTFNQYGTTSSHLHGGLPTDRLTAEWWIKSPRTVALSEGREAEPYNDRVSVTIAVPASIDEYRRNNPALAREIQTRVSIEFDRAFSAGLVVTGFRKESSGGAYLLTTWQSN